MRFIAFCILAFVFHYNLYNQTFVVSADTVCVGTPITFEVPGQEILALNTDTSNPNASVIQQGSPMTYTYVSPGVYPVRAFCVINAIPVFFDKIITVLEIPTLESSLQAICNESSIMFSVSGAVQTNAQGLFSWWVNSELQASSNPSASVLNYKIPKVSSSLSVALKLTNTWVCGSVRDTVLIKNVPASSLNIFPSNITEATCGLTDGSISMLAIGGVPPYTYRWNTGDTTLELNNIATGTYTLSVTDASGCQKFNTQHITNTVGSVQITSTNIIPPTCPEQQNGSIAIEYQNNASGDVSIFWSTGEVNNTQISNLAEGNYFVKVQNKNGCTATQNFPLFAPTDALSIQSIVPIHPTCGLDNGAVSIQPQGQFPPFSLSYGSYTGETNTGMPQGYYRVTLTDARGCVFNQDFTLTEILSTDLSLEVLQLQPAACNTSNGATTLALKSSSNYSLSGLEVEGASTYSISGNDTLFTIQGLAAASHTVKLSAINASQQTCTNTYTLSIPQQKPSAPNVCVVSVQDSNYNTVTFVPTSPGTYRIYREDFEYGTYNLVKQLELSTVDPVLYQDLKTNAALKSHQYKITRVDACGAESNFGEPHRTVHLHTQRTDLGDELLSWQPYNGFVIDSVRVLIDTTGLALDSLFFEYTTLAPGATSYTFTAADIAGDPILERASGGGRLSFLVEYVRNDSCTALKTNNSNNNGRSNKGRCCKNGTVAFVAYGNVSETLGPGACNGSMWVEVYGGQAPFTYTWSSPGLNGDSVGGLCGGDYIVTVTGTNNSSTLAYGTVELGTALPQLESNFTSLYPNPNSGVFYLQGFNGQLELTLYTLQGNLVWQSISTENQPIEVPASLATGLYTLELKHQNTVSRTKLIIQR